MNARSSGAIGIVGLVLTLGSGCSGGGDGIARQAVSGSVTFDGKPLDHGEIILNPIQAGPSAGGTVAGGAFKIDRSGGPAAGKYRVMIMSIQPTGRQVPDVEGPPGSKVAEQANVIPERYNFKTDLEIEVVREGPNQFTFDLVSKPKIK
jgi:hypothetical protein